MRNLLAVLAAGVACWILGAAWYTALAGPWRQAVGKTEEELKSRNPAIPFGGSLAGYLAAAAILAGLLAASGAATAGAGARFGLLVGLCAAVLVTAGDYLYAARPLPLFFINGGFHLAGLALMGAILGAWRQ